MKNFKLVKQRGRLADRFTKHRSIKNNSPELPVAAAHCNSPEHSILNARVSIITICADTYKKTEEERLIYKLGTF